VLIRPISIACCAVYMRAKNHISLARFWPVRADASTNSICQYMLLQATFRHWHVQNTEA
jgi:hypothetical protein